MLDPLVSSLMICCHGVGEENDGRRIRGTFCGETTYPITLISTNGQYGERQVPVRQNAIGLGLGLYDPPCPVSTRYLRIIQMRRKVNHQLRICWMCPTKHLSIVRLYLSKIPEQRKKPSPGQTIHRELHLSPIRKLPVDCGSTLF